MNKPSYIIGDTFVTLVHNGNLYTITHDDARCDAVLDVIKNQNWSELDNVLSLPKLIAKYSFGKIKVYDNAIYYKDKEVKNIVTEKIFSFITQGYPFESLVAFLDKLMLNPEARSIDQLYSYLEKYKLPICEDGDFLAMKSIRGEWKDHYSNTIDNRIGQKPWMNRGLISSDPNLACHIGFHIGSEQFVNTYCDLKDRRIILCKINPANVVCIPYYSSFQKMRVCAYEVVRELDEQFHGVNFNSDYAPANSHVDPSIPLKPIYHNKRNKLGRFVKANKK